MILSAIDIEYTDASIRIEAKVIPWHFRKLGLLLTKDFM